MAIEGATFTDTLTLDASHQTPGKWQHVSHTFQPIGGDSLTIKLSISRKGLKANTQFDNVQLSYVPD